jgi:hypothetical protein
MVLNFRSSDLAQDDGFSFLIALGVSNSLYRCSGLESLTGESVVKAQRRGRDGGNWLIVRQISNNFQLLAK